MTNIDQFESLFKKADKSRFVFEPAELQTVLVVTDLGSDPSAGFAAGVRQYLSVLDRYEDLQWQVADGQGHASVSELLTEISRLKPDLICTYRNLHAPAADFPFSLGVYLDVLAQATSIPMLVVPSPHRPQTSLPAETRVVMAITDHLAGDNRLVSNAAQMTREGGTLWLTHVEDVAVFERYIATIGKIPSIDTEDAREKIMEQLLAEPHDFIESCGQVLQECGLPIEVQELVTLGHYLRDYARLIEEHEVDLLVMNAKQEDQLAMHGLAYPLSVELRDTPILML